MNSLKNCSGAHIASTGNGHRLPLKVTLFFVALFSFSVLFQSCGHSREEMEYRENEKALADSVAGYAPGIATDTINGITHNFIRHANIKCRMGDVLSATKRIEDIVSLNGGYSSKSDLSSHVNYSTSVPISKDSTIEQVYYTTSVAMTLRVPNKQLDSVLRKITDLAVFINYRTLTSDDVKMKLFANSLAESRLHTYSGRVEKKIETKKNDKLSHVIAAEDSKLEKQTMADETRTSTYDLADQVNYSTLTLELYESQKSFSEKTALIKSIEPYEPSFGEKLGTAFANGFGILKSFVLFIANSWSVILILLVIFIAARKGVAFYSKRYEVNSK